VTTAVNGAAVTSQWAWLSLVSVLVVISGYSVGFGPGWSARDLQGGPENLAHFLYVL